MKIHGDYARHEALCHAKFDGAWLGWKFYAMDGATVIDEKALPRRKLRGTHIKIEEKS